ncbi:hypothetical protein CAPTEDRAFT_134795, partial [Capitella teleta]
AWLNEKFSPCLEESQWEVIECILEQLNLMEANIERAKRVNLAISIHKMEIERIRFMITSYLRLRLRKVEKYAGHLLQQAEDNPENPRMTQEEHTYAREYLANTESHFQSLALRHMPPNLQTLNPEVVNDVPNLDSFVFLQVKEDVEGVMVEDNTPDSREEVINLEKGDQHITRYKPIAPLITSNAVVLI